MPYSYAVYTGNGATTQFTVPFPYIRREHVVVSLNYVSTAFTWVNNTTVQVSPAPANAVRVEVRRVTPVNNPLVDFTDGSTLVAADLDTNALQQTYINQEQDDQIQQGIYVDANGNLTAGNQVLKDLLDPVAPQDAATKNYVDTTTVASAGDTMSGNLAMGNNKVTGLGAPSAGGDAANKTYVDTNDALKVSKAGDTMTGPLAMSGQKITGLGDPTNAQDAVTKTWVETATSAPLVQFRSIFYGAFATDPATDPYGGAPTEGDLYFNTTLDQMRVYNGASWQEASADATITRFKFTAVGGETSLSGNDDNAQSLTYNVGLELVYLNGALLTRGVDYVATTGSSITGLAALSAADLVEVVAFSQINAIGSIPSANITFLQTGTGAVQRTLENKLKKEGVSVWDFGVVGDGVADDTTALQAFFDYIAANDVGTAYCSGSFRVSSGIAFGSGSALTKHVVGDLKITATTAIDTVFTINGFTHGVWDGEIDIVGTGSVSHSSRTCRRGLYITTSGRAKFNKLRLRAFAQYGVMASSNNAGGNTSLVDLGSVAAADCGTGYPGGSNFTASWSNPIQSGSAGSTAQRVVIDVTAVPPAADIGSGTLESMAVLINGEAYYIYSVDSVNNKLTLYPWIDNTLTSGTLTYLYGAGVICQGNDAGIINIDQVDAVRCSIGLWSTSLYGPITKRVVAQSCLTALAVGADPNAAAVTLQVSGLYCENNTCDLLRITRADVSGFIPAEYAFNFDKILYTGGARAANNIRNRAFDNLRSFQLNRYGISREYRRDSNNSPEASSSINIFIGANSSAQSWADKTLVYKRNTSWTLNIQTPNAGIHNAFGDTATTIAIIGTGNNGAPTGTFTFNPPGGYTVNGGASAAFAGFTGPALFCVYWSVATADFDVRCLNQVNQGSATFNPPSVAAAGETTTTVTCTGAALGDYAIASFSLNQQGITLGAYVNAADTVTVVFRNGTASPIDLGSGTLRVRTFKP